jgi:peroxisomal coenzyme A diphosphatase NUDT7
VGYGRQPEFEVNPPGAPTRDQRLAWTMLSKPVYRAACEKEDVRVDWALLRRMVGEGDGGGDGGTPRPKVSERRWRRGVRSKL